MGFNLWRRTASTGRYVRVNARLIPTRSFASASGGRYAFVDRRVQRGRTYSYKLELVTADNRRQWTSAVRVRV